MGICIYCGRKARPFQDEHKACADANRDARHQLSRLFGAILTSSDSVGRVQQAALRIEPPGFVTRDQTAAIFKSSTFQALSSIDTGTISQEADDRIADVGRALGIDVRADPELSTVLSKGAILRCLDLGKLPTFIHVSGTNPFLLANDEEVIWAFHSASHYQTKTVTEYRGSTVGVSYHLFYDFYRHRDVQKGRLIQSDHLTLQGYGELLVTNKNLYFKTATEALRFALGRLISLDILADGIQIVGGEEDKKPNVFEIDDPHFAANLIHRLVAL